MEAHFGRPAMSVAAAARRVASARPYRRALVAAAASAEGGGLPAPAFERRVPEGDTRERDCCTRCGYVAYKNPLVVVSTVVVDETRGVLLAKRAIEPSKGKYGLPQGYMELSETARDAAARETLEETGVVVEPGELLGVFQIPTHSVQLVYLARVMDASGLGAESSETEEARFFEWDALPPDADLAFPTNVWALEAARECLAGPPGAHVPMQRVKRTVDNAPSFEDELAPL